MRLRVEIDSNDVDAVGTVLATISRGGCAQYVYKKRMAVPEYLALIDKRAPDDHHARFVEEILRRLAASEIPIARYYFSNDPRTCFAGALDGHPETLAQLAQLHGDKRLLVFWDASRLIEPLTGRLEEWADLFQAWKQRMLFIPDERWLSQDRRSRLAESFEIYQSGLDGLRAFSGVLGRGFSPSSEAGNRQVVLRELLSVAPERWLSRTAPESTAVERLLGGLKHALDPAAFLWLCACTVYPELRFELTVFLGQNLSTPDKRPLLDSERLSLLTTLPWFRSSYMPDWFRMRLLRELTRTQRRAVRGSLGKLLLKALQKHRREFQLEVAEAERDSAASLFKRLLPRLTANTPPDGALRDHVFIRFWSAWNRLAMPLPGFTRTMLAYPAPAKVAPSIDRYRIISTTITIQIAFTWAVAMHEGIRRYLFSSGPAPRGMDTILSTLWIGLLLMALATLHAGARLRMASLFGLLTAIGCISRLAGVWSSAGTRHTAFLLGYPIVITMVGLIVSAVLHFKINGEDARQGAKL
jgi:hypothetical protein